MTEETKYEPINWGEGLTLSSSVDTEKLYNQNSVLPDNYSVSELKRDEQFANTSERFLKSVGRNEDLLRLETGHNKIKKIMYIYVTNLIMQN